MSTGRKILRACVVQGGKVIEEQRLKERETLTIGSGPKNTFTLGEPSLPKSHERLNELFAAVQSLPDFDGAKFSQHLKELQQTLAQEKAASALRAAAP